VSARLESLAAVLGPALAQWAGRDGTKPEPETRQAANTAVAAIDGMLTELHRIRQQLVSEIRAADDANAARVDELLARYRKEAGR
jgi:hypothetical protein